MLSKSCIFLLIIFLDACLGLVSVQLVETKVYFLWKFSFSSESCSELLLTKKQNHCLSIFQICYEFIGLAWDIYISGIYNIFIWEICFMQIWRRMANQRYVHHLKGKSIHLYLFFCFVLKE